MNLKYYPFILLGIFSPLFFLATSASTLAQGRRFECSSAIYEGNIVPTTVANEPRGGIPIEIIYWTSNFFVTSGVTSQERCEIVSDRFQSNFENGLLQKKYFATGEISGLGVICITRRAGDPCRSEDVLLTLPPGQDPVEALDQLLRLNRTAAGNRPLYLTDDLLTYRNLQVYVDIEVLFEILSD